MTIPVARVTKNRKTYYIYGIMGFVVLSFSIIFSAIFFYNSHQQKYDSIRINLAGRQRMLTQKISRDTLLYKLGKISKQDIMNSMRLFTSTLDALIFGGEAAIDFQGTMLRRLPGMGNKEIRSRLIEILQLWKTEKQSIETYLSQQSEALLDSITATSNTMLVKINDMVLMIQEDSERKNAIGSLISYITLFLSALLLAAYLLINLKRRSIQLEETTRHLEKLKKLLPICSECHRIRTSQETTTDKKSWQSLEEYFAEEQKIKFSHSICPDCIKKLYPNIADKVLKS